MCGAPFLAPAAGWEIVTVWGTVRGPQRGWPLRACVGGSLCLITREDWPFPFTNFISCPFRVTALI